MECNCINEVNKKIQKASGDPEAELDVIYTFDSGIGERLYIPYSYRDKKKDGTYTKEKSGKLTLSNCPFCGKSIKD